MKTQKHMIIPKSEFNQKNSQKYGIYKHLPNPESLKPWFKEEEKENNELLLY